MGWRGGRRGLPAERRRAVEERMGEKTVEGVSGAALPWLLAHTREAGLVPLVLPSPGKMAALWHA